MYYNFSFYLNTSHDKWWSVKVCWITRDPCMWFCLTNKCSSSYKVFRTARVYLPLGGWHGSLIITSENWRETLEQDSKKNHFPRWSIQRYSLYWVMYKTCPISMSYFLHILNNYSLRNLHMKSCSLYKHINRFNRTEHEKCSQYQLITMLVLTAWMDLVYRNFNYYGRTHTQERRRKHRWALGKVWTLPSFWSHW